MIQKIQSAPPNHQFSVSITKIFLLISLKTLLLLILLYNIKIFNTKIMVRNNLFNEMDYSIYYN